ncbi:MAG: hypothetical protein ACAH83_18395 [Alphaproteobacteria bacterium]
MPRNDDFNKSLDDMREKTKALNDSLKTLTSQGLEGLNRAVHQSITRRGGTDAGTVVTQELSLLLRKELTTGIAALLNGGKTSPLSGLFPGAPARDGGISVVIHNNTPAAVTATPGLDSFDRKSLEITIDQMVANALTQGSETTGILRSLFGLVPGLIGR